MKAELQQQPCLSIRSVAGICSAFSLVVVAALLVLYVTHLGKPHFTSDDAVLNLMAESIHDQASLFAEGWVTNNGDLMMPSGVLLIAPLLQWWPNSYGLHAVAGVFAIIAVLGAFLFFLRCARVPIAVMFAATAFLASGLSWLSAIFVYLQTTYAWWPAAFFFCAALVVRHRFGTGGFFNPRVRLVAVFITVFLVALANPGRVALMVVLPLYAFDRALAFRLARPPDEERGIQRAFRRLGLRDPLVCFGMGTAFLAAMALYYLLLQSGVVNTAHHASRLQWEGYAGVAKHARIFASSWLEYLGGMREANAGSSFLENLLRPIRIVLAVGLSWVGIAEVASLHKPGHPVRRALAAALVLSFFPILFIYLAFSPLAADVGTTRYFTVSIVIMVGLAAFRFSEVHGRWRKWVPNAVTGASLVLIPICALRFVPAVGSPQLGLLETHSSSQMRLADVLITENLRWGYATWWNAGAVTVFSKEKSRVSPVVAVGSNISRFPTMTQRRWYVDEQWGDESFLALSRHEATPAQLSALGARFGDPARVVETTEYKIFVYSRNIAGDFVCSSRLAMDAALHHEWAPGRISSATLLTDLKQNAFGTVRVIVSNEGGQAFDGIGPYPVSIGMQLFDASGQMLNPDWVHFPLECAVPAGAARTFLVPLPEKMPPGSRVEIDLVQENVAWFQQWGAPIVTLHDEN